jgi:hypothetical protein
MALYMVCKLALIAPFLGVYQVYKPTECAKNGLALIDISRYICSSCLLLFTAQADLYSSSEAGNPIFTTHLIQSPALSSYQLQPIYPDYSRNSHAYPQIPC